MSHPVAPTRTLVIGSGAREHALAWKLAAEPGVNEVVVAPGNVAIAALPRVRTFAELDPLDPAAVVDLARAMGAELVVVGPEQPLATGLADALETARIPVFGPTAAAARIETSKAWCHEVAAAAGIAMAGAAIFDEAAAALHHARGLVERTGGVVVKADGLAGGKGVSVCRDAGAAEVAIRQLFADGPARVLIEERLVGREASVIAICDGRTAVGLPAARDHKRLADGDGGPNTGGMGAYSPLPDLSDDDVEAIVDSFHRPALAELATRGTPFRGALYAGLMLTEAGPYLLEFNARFGDPETQVLLPRLATALGPLLMSAARGDLSGAVSAPNGRLPVLPGATIGIVLAAAGYPGTPRRGDPIEGLDGIGDGLAFHAGTSRDENGTWRTAGGRVLTVVGRGRDLAAAREDAERLAGLIFFEGLQRRHDIGLDVLVGSR